MKTILRIGATDYDHTASGRAAAGIESMQLTLSVESQSMLTFTVKVCGASAPFVPGVPVKLTTTDDDGSNPHVRFQGDLDDPQQQVGPTGLVWAYACTDLKHRANWVTVQGPDGTGSANFNLQPDDGLALYALSGQTVGAILQAILEGDAVATSLDALGVGNYASLTPPTLPAATLADLALLDVVPPNPVQLRGESLLNNLESLVNRWHPQFALWVDQSDGTIRVADIFAFTPHALTVPTNTDDGDDIDWPTFNGPTCKNCFTALRIAGLDIDRAILSVVDGTLVKGWSDADEAAWTINEFFRPGDASDEGTLSSVTTSSATVTSDFAAAHWVANFWNDTDRGGWIQFFDLAGTGIDIQESRQITSCTALTAGGSASIGWDSSQPLASTSYDRYRIVGLNSPKAIVGRKFFVQEPANLVGSPPAPAQGDQTFVGSHLYPRFPKGINIANLTSVQTVSYPTAIVRWSPTGDYPWFEVPIKCQVNPVEGSITLMKPAVQVFGDPGVLEDHYPTTFADGLFYDIVIHVPYNRGSLYARAPSTGYSGTAYTTYGIERERTYFLDAFTWAGDTAAIALLAEQHLKVVQDAVIEGSCHFHGIPASFDPFTLGYSLSFDYPSPLTSPIQGLSLPVRTVTIDWPDDGEIHTATFQYSNLKRPFEGDDLFIHPAASGRTFGTESGVWMAAPGGYGDGTMDMGEYNDMASTQAPPPPSNPIGDAIANFGTEGSQFAGMDLGSMVPPGSSPKNDATKARDLKVQGRQDREDAFRAQQNGDPAPRMTSAGERPKVRAKPKPAPKPRFPKLTTQQRRDRVEARQAREDGFRRGLDAPGFTPVSEGKDPGTPIQVDDPLEGGG